MKKSIVFVLSLLFLCISCSKPRPSKDSLLTVFEKSNGLETVTYHEGIQYWENLAESFNELSLHTYGKTDAGLPLHLAILSDDECSIFDLAERGDKRLLLINNAIHPGESDGVDASMLLFRDILTSEKDYREELTKDLIIVAIPFYNIGGALNRNSHSRANQNGPLEYGFRGNAQNLDLNRDFIKCDSRNAQTFVKLIQHIDPELYIETHVSNGADYQYTMTYLPGHFDKMGMMLGKEMDFMLDLIKNSFGDSSPGIVPYVNTHKQVPDSGIISFYDSPRYSTGYLSTLGIPGIITETHMLKPYKQRVEATYDFVKRCVIYMADWEQGPRLKHAKYLERNDIISETKHPVHWEVNMNEYRPLTFHGYEFEYRNSEVSGSPRLFYDTTKPFTKQIKYYHRLNPVITKDKPKAYILKRGFVDVEHLLKLNKVNMQALESDTVFTVIRTKIDSFKTVGQAYEKHYLHSKVAVTEDTITLRFQKGDWVIPMGTNKDRFVMEMLEAEGPDSYFAWNFFDAILQQKEWYSPYVFEDSAVELLATDSALRAKFKAKKVEEESFRNNPQYQLFWIYQHSPHYEKEHMIMPVFKLLP